MEKSKKTAGLEGRHQECLDCADHNKLWKILKEIVVPGHLTCSLRNLDAGQESIVRTRQGTMDWFKYGKEYIKAVYFTLLV